MRLKRLEELNFQKRHFEKTTEHSSGRAGGPGGGGCGPLTWHSGIVFQLGFLTQVYG
jgi:hypothetical protein